MKKNTFRRIASTALAALMSASVLTGCNSKAQPTEAPPEFAYIPEYFSLDGDITDIRSVAYHDNMLYFISTSYEDVDFGDLPPSVLPPRRATATNIDTPVDEVDEADGEEPVDGEAGSEETGEGDSDEPSSTSPPAAIPRAFVSSSGGGVIVSSPAMRSAGTANVSVVESEPAEGEESDSEDVDAEESDGENTTDDLQVPEDYIDYPMPEYYSRPVTKLYKVGIDGTGLEELKNFKMTEIPEGKMGDSYIQNMTVDRDGSIWVQEYYNAYLMDEDYNYSEEESKMLLRRIDNTGTELSRIDTSELLTDQNSYVQSVRIDDNGNIYLTSYSYGVEMMSPEHSLKVLDSSGALLVNLTSSNWLDNLLMLGDGRIGVLTYDEATQKQVIQFVDLTTRGWGDKIPVAGNIWNTMPGNEEYDLFYTDSSSFYGLNFPEPGSDDETETTMILNWINADINPDSIMVTAPLSDGRILCISQNYDRNTYESKMEFALLTKRPYSELPERTVITLATMWLDYNVRSDIIQFNKTNEKYRISVTEYSQYIDYDSDDPYNLIQTRFNTEIISGKVPDIIFLSSDMPVKQFASKGLLDDLYTFIDNDPELNREDFLPNIMKILEYDGKLVQMTSSFSITTFVGLVSKLGPGQGITLSELRAAIADNPGARPFDFYYTKDQILASCLSMGMDSYIDWASGKCSFNTPEFAEILEFANQFPEEFDWEKESETGYRDSYADFRAGTQLLLNSYISDFMNFQYSLMEYGGEVAFKGFPTDTRDGHAMQLNSGFAITTKCKEKDGAWEFLRRYLTEEFQSSNNTWNFPTNINSLNKLAEVAMTDEYYDDPITGERVRQPKMSYYDQASNMPVEVYAMTQEQVDTVMDFINSVTRTYTYDTEILKIISEEAIPFFKGEKTAVATTDIIQNRISIYINEQR